MVRMTMTDALEQFEDLLTAFTLLHHTNRRSDDALRATLRTTTAGIVDEFLAGLTDSTRNAGDDDALR